MSVALAARATWRRPPTIANPYLRYGLYGLIAAYLVWASRRCRSLGARRPGHPARRHDLRPRARPILPRSLLVDGFVESIQIAIIATFLGVLLSVVLGILAARNVVPRAVYLVGRAIIAVARSFHPVIVAIIFVKAVGFGPIAGILTLIVYSIGFVGKLMAEAIEEIDPGQVEAVRATGGGFLRSWPTPCSRRLPRQVGLSITSSTATCAPRDVMSAPAASAAR